MPRGCLFAFLAFLAVVVLMAVFQPSAGDIETVALLWILAVPISGVAWLLWTSWRDNRLTASYSQRLRLEAEAYEERVRREQNELTQQQGEVILEEYERGYAEQKSGEPSAPWNPVMEADNDTQVEFVARARTYYLAGRLDASQEKPDRIAAWRTAGGTLDGGELPPLTG